MDLTKAQDYYYDLLGHGILLDIFPDMTGEWENDRDLFVMEYKAMMD